MPYGFYVGNWNSNVNGNAAGYSGGNIEMDLYGGYKAAFGDFGLDVGGIFYYYPGSSVNGGKNNGDTVTNKEVYLGASWKFISAKVYYSVDDYFSMRGFDNTGTATSKGTRGSMYGDLSANFDLGNGWGINGHVGYMDVKNQANAEKGKEVLKFFDWAYTNGGKMAAELDYVPMPAAVVTQIRDAWKVQIRDGSGKSIW